MTPEGFKRAVEKDFALNTPTLEPIYDENGVLLLRPGYVITMQRLVDQLLVRGCYLKLPPKDAPPPLEDADGAPSARAVGAGSIDAARAPVFIRASDMAHSMRRIQKMLAQPPSPANPVHAYVRECALHLIAMTDEDADAVLASIYLSTDVTDYRSGQQLMGATITALLAPQLNFNKEQCWTLVCAALTRDAGLAEFERTWGKAGNSLPDTAHASIAVHPHESVRILEAHGVRDPLWLRYVKEHHERPDGKGYPAKLEGPAMLPGSMLLGVVDAYASMVLPSAHAAAKFPANALKELFLEKGFRYGEQQVALLLKNLTRFPAGTLVSLANGEIGLVKKTLRDGAALQVFAIYDGKGVPRSSPIQRDASLPEFTITGCVLPAKCKSASMVIRRLWQSPG